MSPSDNLPRIGGPAAQPELLYEEMAHSRTIRRRNLSGRPLTQIGWVTDRAGRRLFAAVATQVSFVPVADIIEPEAPR